MRTWVGLWTIIFVVLGAASVNAGPITEPGPGMWSATAAYLWPGGTVIRDYAWEGREIHIPSPDNRYSLRVSGSTLAVFDQRAGARGAIGSVPIHSLAEVEWSPDSSAFYVNHSEGGWVGSWSVSVYWVRRAGVVKLDVTREALVDFSVKMEQWCPGEYPNMVAAGWIDGSQAILLVGEVPPHSSCKGMGNVYGYLVSSDGRVFASYDSEALRTQWARYLGPRLVGNVNPDRPLPPDGWRYPGEGDYKGGWQEFRKSLPIPFHIEADFNADEIEDHAWILISNRDVAAGLFVFLGQKDAGPKIIRVDKRYYGKTAPQRMGLGVVAPGEYRTACGKGYWECRPGEPEVLELSRPAIEYFMFESASSIFWWDEQTKSFKRTWISD